MPEHLDGLLLTNLARYIRGSMSLDAFEQWLIPATWDVEKVGNTALIDLVSQIKLRLAEFSNGHWTEKELREQLLKLVGESPVLRD